MTWEAGLNNQMTGWVGTQLKLEDKWSPRQCASLETSLHKEPTCQCRRHMRRRFDSWVRKIPCSRKWQPGLVFLPGKLYGQRRLVSYSLWGCTESDITEQLSTHPHPHIHTHTHTHNGWVMVMESMWSWVLGHPVGWEDWIFLRQFLALRILRKVWMPQILSDQGPG